MKCSACGKNDSTVDRNMFDGMCADCTDKALNDHNLANRAKQKNDRMKIMEDRDYDSSYEV